MSPIASTAANATPQPSVQQSSLQQTCKLAGCNKPVCVEPNGKVHEFCGRKHASDYKSNGTPPHLKKCSNPSCGRMKCKENGKYLDYCGKSCRDSYRGSQQQVLLPENTCLLPGC